MYGLNDKAGRVVCKGLSINLTGESSQAEFKRAVKRAPKLLGKQIIELTEAQIKQRASKSKTKTVKNDSQKEKAD